MTATGTGRAPTPTWVVSSVIVVFAVARGAQRVATGVALQQMDPWTVMAGSIVAALALWLPIAYFAGWLVWKQDLWVRAAPLGLVNIVVAGITLIAAQQYLTAGLTAVIVAALPLVVAVFAAVFLKEKVTAFGVVGILLGTVGVVIVTVGRGGALDATNWALGLVLAGAGVLSLATVYVGWRDLLATYPGAVLLAPQLAVSAVVAVPVAAFLGGHAPVSWTAVGTLTALGVISMIVPQLAMFWLLARTTALRAALANYLAPLFAALLAVPILGQPVNVLVVSGGLFVIAGAVVANLAKARGS